MLLLPRPKWTAAYLLLLFLVCLVTADDDDDDESGRGEGRGERRRVDGGNGVGVGGVGIAAIPSIELLCPEGCQCTATSAECVRLGLMGVPAQLDQWTLLRKIDLSYNNITHLYENSFSSFVNLEELLLDGNNIYSVHPKAFRDIPLRVLSLQENDLGSIPWVAISGLGQLHTLNLARNQISDIINDGVSLPPTNLTNLQKLRLDENRIHSITPRVFAPLSNLEALNLASNRIIDIPADAFRDLHKLVILILQRNSVENVHDDAFAGLNSLKVLGINDNRLDHIPEAIRKLKSLEDLTVAGNRITYVPGDLLQSIRHLTLIELKGNPILKVDRNAFANLPKLKKLIISEARELSFFPNLNGTVSLEILRIDRSSLTTVADQLCNFCKRLKSLDLKSNKLERMPLLEDCKELRLLDLTHNRIRNLEGSPFKSLSQLQDLLLGNNLITSVPGDAFVGLNRLEILDFSSNEITVIDQDAFLPLTHLVDLNIGYNKFSELPSRGLENVVQLKTFNNPNLREFPGPEKFPRVQKLLLSYAYHCCQFLNYVPDDETTIEDREPVTELKESVLFPTGEYDISLWSMNMTDIWPGYQNLTSKFGSVTEDLVNNFGSDLQYPANFPNLVEDYYEETPGIGHIVPGKFSRKKIACIPQPGPFMPCQDLFDWWTLRCGVWIVFLLAMLGNGTVVFVLIFSRSKMDVPRFLVCNLAMADFFMGVYLGFLAVVDASTLGEFRMYAIPWQMSAGCQIAGFLGVLSSELSVYTLAVITLERNYAITHAMHLNKRLSLKHAAYIMTCGWLFATFTAMMPLFGISDYRKFAVCLPFEIENGLSLGYVLFLMCINGVSFLILMGCYLKMYCAIRGSQAWNSNDSRIAKRMALLVFTDFICWAPIAFFSLTSTFGLHLITLEEAKVFTVFVLPLNSCCNPFLYAILTKQFKKDCVLICKAIEESRVTRGIGRCRHSSNFSNQKTPANTNSLVDKSNSSNPERQMHHQPCHCNVRRIENMKQQPRPLSWQDVANFFLCFRKQQSESLNDYAYQIAEIQQKQHQKHKRNSSVSSENFSSSRSDSWRQANCASIPLKLLEHRRRNSWTVTRKPSQDSNMSSSRNDSSATTASTSTWRMSRSSVSSDVSSNARHPTGPTLPNDVHQSAAAAVAAVTQANARLPARHAALPPPILRQNSNIGKQSPEAVPRPDLPTCVSPSRSPLLARSSTTSSSGSIRAKPRLTRQSAIQLEDSLPPKAVSFESEFLRGVVALPVDPTAPPQPPGPVPLRPAHDYGPQRKLSTISSKSSIARESCGHINLLDSVDKGDGSRVMSRSLTNVAVPAPRIEAPAKCPSDRSMDEVGRQSSRPPIRAHSEQLPVSSGSDEDEVFDFEPPATRKSKKDTRRLSLQAKVHGRHETMPLISSPETARAAGRDSNQPLL